MIIATQTFFTMKKLLIGLVLASQTAFAQQFYSYDNPSREFDVGVKERKIELKIITVNDPIKTCREISKQFNFGWTSLSNSCAYWTTDFTECTVILPKKTTMHLIGHEILHCMVGSWHN